MTGSESNRTVKQTLGLVTLPDELIVALNVNDRFLTKFSCSPFEQRELVIGWLFTQGLIEEYSEIQRHDIRDGTAKMWVWLKEEYPERFKALSPTASSSCGGGSFNSRIYGSMRPLYRPYTPVLDQLKTLAGVMLDRAQMYRVHGGVHCAMLADNRDGTVLTSSEDIAGHNALDKVLGWGLEREIDFAPLLLFVTARVSSDMVLKCYRAGISTLVSLNTLTGLAFEIAARTDQTLVCHVLKPRPILINF